MRTPRLHAWKSWKSCAKHVCAGPVAFAAVEAVFEAREACFHVAHEIGIGVTSKQRHEVRCGLRHGSIPGNSPEP